MAVQFPVDFRLNVTPDFPLFVRATPIFCQPQHVQENVYRCYSHVHATDATNQGGINFFKVINTVLHYDILFRSTRKCSPSCYSVHIKCER